MEKYVLDLKTEYWECSDGCCSGTGTEVFINEDIRVGGFSDLGPCQMDDIKRFVSELNKEHEKLELIFTVELDEDGDISDLIYLNETLIANTVADSNVYPMILEKLGIVFEEIHYDYEYNVWVKEKKLVTYIDKVIPSTKRVTW